MEVDTGPGITEVLNESQMADAWLLAIVGVGGVIVLAIASACLAWLAYRRWRKAERLPTDTDIGAMVAGGYKAFADDVLITVNDRADQTDRMAAERADHTDKRLNRFADELAHLAAGQQRQDQAINLADEKATQAKNIQAKVVNALDRAPTGRHSM